MRAFGASEADIATALKAREETDFDLYPENESAINVFLAMRTQWRTAGLSGRPYGFDYSALPFVMDLAGIKADQRLEVFGQVRLAESTVLEFLDQQ